MEKLKGFDQMLRDERPGIVSRCVQDAKDRLDSVIMNILESKVKSMIEELAAGAGIPLRLRDVRDKNSTLEDFDAALTAKLNTLARTDFASLRQVNREGVAEVVAAKVGDKLGIGSLYPVENFRKAMSDQLVSSFDARTPSPLFDAGLVAEIERRTALGFAEISERAKTGGNVSSSYGAPRDAEHAAKRAANRARQAKYRKKNHLVWVAIGDSTTSKKGNGREGLSGVNSGNSKPICDKNYVYKPTTT